MLQPIDHKQLYRAGLPPMQAVGMAGAVNTIFSRHAGAPEETSPLIWDELRKYIIKPNTPPEVKRLLYDVAFAGWDEEKLGPRPVWRATLEQLKSSNIQSLMDAHGFETCDELYQWSITRGQDFWQEMVERVGAKFKTGYKELVDTSNPKAPKWFPGAELNIADSLFQADPNAIAIKYQQEDGPMREVTYGELDALSNRVASGLVKQGFIPGDHIGLDMPFNVEAVAAYIGIIKAGCTAVCFADSYQPPELDVRLKQIPGGVKAIFTQDFSGGKKQFPLYDNIIKAKHTPQAIVMFGGANAPELKRPGDISWDHFMRDTSDKFESVACDPEHNISVLFSSSTTTGKEKEGDEPKPPKAIAWKANTAFKSAIDAHLHHNMQPGKTLSWLTNMGWMMGPYGIFGTMMNKGSFAMFDGNVVSKDLSKFIEKAEVNVLGLVPAIAEQWEQKRCMEGCDWSRIEMLSSTGLASRPDNYFYLMSLVPGFAPVIECCGGTEIGGGYIASTLHHMASPSMFTMPTFGTELAFPKDGGHPNFEQDEMAIVMRTGNGTTPPMGLSTELLNFNNEEKYFSHNATNAEGHPLREHNDAIGRKPNGFMRYLRRTDNATKINGIKTSSEELESFIKDAARAGKIPGLEDVIVVGVPPPEGGADIIVVFPVMAEGSALKGEALRAAFRDAFREHNAQLGRVDAVASLKDGIPCTASNKIMRRWAGDNWLEEQQRLEKQGKGFFAEAVKGHHI